jgi:hypothetical protein
MIEDVQEAVKRRRKPQNKKKPYYGQEVLEKERGSSPFLIFHQDLWPRLCMYRRKIVEAMCRVSSQKKAKNFIIVKLRARLRRISERKKTFKREARSFMGTSTKFTGSPFSIDC